MDRIDDAENACGSTLLNAILLSLRSFTGCPRSAFGPVPVVAWAVTWVASLLTLSSSSLPAAEIPSAVLIKVEDNKTPEVVPFYRQVSPTHIADRGLLVWSEGAQEYCQPCPVQDVDRFEPQALLVGSRGGAFGSGENSQAGDALAMATMQIDQIRFLPRFKGKGFITPGQQGRRLDPLITIRRQPRTTQPEYPAVTVELLKRGRVLFEFPLKEGQKKVKWREIGSLPESLKNGLSPGEYVFRVKGGSETASFVVEDAELREWVWDLPDRLGRLLGTKNDSLYLQVTVEHLLAQTDHRGAPQPYLADALDVLEDAPADALTPFLNRLRNDILARLDADPSSEDPADFDDPTGIPAIDQARMLIAAGRWDEATAKLESPEALKTPRSQALSTLYQAVILAESAQAMEAKARAGFRLAISQLADGQPEDAYRAHNNYANFLLCRAQDRLYNQAFEVASGVPNSLIHSLVHWREAFEHYTKAGKIAEQLDEERQAAVRVNVARTYALLADVIRTLDAPVSGKRRFTAQEDAVHHYAANLAKKVVEADAENVHSLTRAAGHEVLAHIAYREDHSKACRKHAEKCSSLYTASGSLPGIAGIHRILGLLELRSAATTKSGTAMAKRREAALRHFQLAHFLSEFLRQRIAEDNIGLTRAGYLARHAYVSRKIVELLIAEDRPSEALSYAESAKARALHDLIALRRVGARTMAVEPPAVADILSNWPEKTAAVEYFLGNERAWVFLVDTSGKVTVYPVVGSNGVPVRARDLVARVQAFIEGIDRLGPIEGRRIAYRAMGGNKPHFDPKWQGELHWFYRTLLPSAVIVRLRKAETVVIVPHHNLHYFPFAALVSEPDATTPSLTRMPLPKFLVEEPFSLVYAPSIGAWSALREREVRPLEQVQAMGIVDFAGRADRLSGVRTEMDNLKVVFRDRVRTVLTDREVTESNVRRLLAMPGILSLATHGQKMPDRPLEGYLLCRDERHAISELTAAELYDSQVGSDLIVLNACYGGFGDASPMPGDDLFGIQRALLCAGGRTVVSGVWDIYDATAPDIMHDFYKGIAKGVSAPQALAEAQRAHLEKWRRSSQEPLRFLTHPYYWAVFNIAGDDRTGSVLSSSGRQPCIAHAESATQKNQGEATHLSELRSSAEIENADEASEQTAKGQREPEQHDVPDSPVESPVVLDDPEFARFVDVSLIPRAVLSLDASLLTDLALQTEKGERVLGRVSTVITASDLFVLAVRTAVIAQDEATLRRLKRIAQSRKHRTLEDQLTGALRLAADSRVPPAMVSSTEDTTRNVSGYVHDIRLAGVLASTEMLSRTEDDIAASGLDVLEVEQLKKLIGEIRNSFLRKTEGQAAINALTHGSRGRPSATFDPRKLNGMLPRQPWPYSRMSVAMEVLVNGRPLRQINHHGRTYVPIPRLGVEYSIRVHNRGPKRIVAIVSVDGLSVMNGQPASVNGSGYVIRPQAFYTIRGWRRGSESVAAFSLQPRDSSYAAKRGYSSRIGIIRLIAHEELTQPVSSAPTWRADAVGSRLSAGAGTSSLGSTGTGFGRDVTSRVVSVPFHRSNNKREIMLIYDRRETLAAAGVPVDNVTWPAGISVR